jgi:hypothetical protein
MGMSLTIKRKTWIVDEYGYVRQFFAWNRATGFPIAPYVSLFSWH